jgi:Hypoxia induced protein conserved region
MFMIILLVLLIVAAAGAVVFALVRGLHAFAHLRPAEVGEDGIPKSLAIQNKMMFARVKWQAVTILLIVALIVLAKS